MTIATQILANVEGQRLQKAVDGLISGAYTITIASQYEQEIRGFVANRDHKDYGVVISQEHNFCGCRDAMFRQITCKHMVSLALYTIRNPQEEPKKEECKPNLKLAKVRPGFCG